MGIIFFIFGIVFGSFYNVLIYRVPLNMTISKGRSMCTSCKTTLKAIDLIPVFSWLFLKRRCRYCKEKISWRYPLIELLTGIVFLITYLHFGYNLYLIIVYLPFFSMLIVTAMIDYDHMVICTEILIGFSVISFVGLLLLRVPIKGNLLGAIIGFAFYFVVYLVAKAFYKKEAFGFGDVLYIAAIGLVLGIRDTIMVAIVSFYVALIMIVVFKIFGKKFNLKEEIPFGPSMSITAFFVALYGNQIYAWYTSLF